MSDERLVFRRSYELAFYYSSGMVILTGNAHPTLSQLVCERMGIRMGDAVVSLLNYTLAIIHILGLQ